MNRLVQFRDEKSGEARVARVSADGTRLGSIGKGLSTYDLAAQAAGQGASLEILIKELGVGAELDYGRIVAENRLLPPLTHPDPAHMLVSGTGLTHLGSAATRSAMHAKIGAAEDELTDSMKMFKWGLAGGKPEGGAVGVAPEWFFKGDGSWVVAPGANLELPDFALDGGEEPEIVGLYFIGADGTPWRLGFALGNEYSDHVLERRNYLLLAHSKLRNSAFGPELLLGELPADVRGWSRLKRNGETLWEKPFLSGEANMSHSIANLEHHHFKYARFRRPGDVHAHFFGTATLSFADGIKAEPGDRFEISAEGFGRPLSNTLASIPSPVSRVRTL